jgi:hypothetical protein
MKILKRILFIVIGLVLLLAIIGLFLPKTSRLERSITIKSKAEVPFELINNLKEWEKWSPWNGMDTATVWVFSENYIGKDAYYTWSSENKNVGKGKMDFRKRIRIESIFQIFWISLGKYGWT